MLIDATRISCEEEINKGTKQTKDGELLVSGLVMVAARKVISFSSQPRDDEVLRERTQMRIEWVCGRADAGTRCGGESEKSAHVCQESAVSVRRPSPVTLSPIVFEPRSRLAARRVRVTDARLFLFLSCSLPCSFVSSNVQSTAYNKISAPDPLHSV